MRAVKIDPVSRTVTEIDLKKNPNRTFAELYEIDATSWNWWSLIGLRTRLRPDKGR